MSYLFGTSKQIKLTCDELWDKCMLNPISDISFEVTEETFSDFVSYMRFYNEPDTVYYYSKFGNEDETYTRPVEAIKRHLPENLHHKIIYFYTLMGTLVVLKGSFYDFPMDKLMYNFNVEEISYGVFAIFEKRKDHSIVGKSNYLKTAVIKGVFDKVKV